MTTHNPFTVLRLCLCGLLIAGVVVAQGKMAAGEQETESALRPFDAQKVAKLSHEAYKIAWDVKFWARHDLRFAAFRPTALDREVVDYLNEIRLKAPWVARDIEKHPATPRASSKRSHDFVSYDAMLLKLRYQPASFRRSTGIKIEKLLGILDEIASYYDEKDGTSSNDSNQTSK